MTTNKENTNKLINDTFKLISGYKASDEGMIEVLVKSIEGSNSQIGRYENMSRIFKDEEEYVKMNNKFIEAEKKRIETYNKFIEVIRIISREQLEEVFLFVRTDSKELLKEVVLLHIEAFNIENEGRRTYVELRNKCSIENMETKDDYIIASNIQEIQESKTFCNEELKNG